MYLLAYNHLLLGEEGGDQEGELRDAFSTVSSSTLKHIAQHTLSILWGWGGGIRMKVQRKSSWTHPHLVLTVAVRPTTG